MKPRSIEVFEIGNQETLIRQLQISAQRYDEFSGKKTSPYFLSVNSQQVNEIQANLLKEVKDLTARVAAVAKFKEEMAALEERFYSGDECIEVPDFLIPRS